MTAISGRIAEFRERGCDVLGVSTDSLTTHERWLETSPAQGGLGGLNFPLAADEDGSVCRAYGVYLDKQHVALRGLFLIDPNGVLQYQVVHSMTMGRNPDEVLRVLEGLQMGGLCPAEWQRGEAVLDASRELAVGRVIGPYRIEAELGRGAFATVFRARDITLDRAVALKVLHPGGVATALLAEARASAALNHPNVCIIHAVDSSEGAPMIVMEYITGRPLSQLLGEGPVPPAQVVALGRQVALGMAAAHSQGVIHGDLKPANILVTPTGTVKIVDFGMARRSPLQVQPDDTGVWDPGSAGISGTPAYMALEQARGLPATPASDVFSLGVILHELLTGRRARTEGSLLELLHHIEAEDLTGQLVQTPEPLASILRFALVASPSARQITMAQIADRLG